MAQAIDAPHVPGILTQFDDLKHHTEALGFHLLPGTIKDDPYYEPVSSRHNQGLIRYYKDGKNYFYVTRNGNPKSGNVYVGTLSVVRMDSRDPNGERLRSNRLQKDKDTNDTTPDSRDRVIKLIRFDGLDSDYSVPFVDWASYISPAVSEGFPAYAHAAGMEIVGHTLFISLEKPYKLKSPGDTSHWGFEYELLTDEERIDQNLTEGAILMVDISDPENPVPGKLIPMTLDRNFPALFSHEAGMVGVTFNPQDEHYYLITSYGNFNDSVIVYRSNGLDLDDPGFDMTFWKAWDRDEYIGHGEVWPPRSRTVFNEGTGFQNMSFVRDLASGQLYMIGTRDTVQGGGGESQVWLNKVEIANDDTTHAKTFTIEYIDDKQLYTNYLGSQPGEDFGSLAAGGSVYVSPDGNLIIYGLAHDVSGPEDTYKLEEWRNRNGVRAGSDTYNPTVQFEHTDYTVDEGSAVTVSATAQGPITKAWVELYSDPDYDKKSLVIDYPDWAKDDYGDFRKFEGNGFSDKASSMRWFAPQGCTLRVNDDDLEDIAGGSENAHTLVLEGDGLVHAVDDLKEAPYTITVGGQTISTTVDVDDEFTSMEFLPGCDDYYDAAMSVTWHWSDANGPSSATGASISFDASQADGPSDIPVTGEATHPTDGRTGTGSVVVHVLNVAPAVSLPTPITAECGASLDVPVSFSDPGLLDTHIASVEWDDGTPGDDLDPVSPPTFTVSHTYGAIGDYSLRVSVTDDDGGEGSVTADVSTEDTLAPEVTLDTDRDSLWPPNRTMVPVHLVVTANDLCDGSLALQTQVYSTVDGFADAAHDPDAEFVDAETLMLRAERGPGSVPRVYLIVVQATDASGNTGFAVASVVVPGSRSNADHAAVQDLADTAVAYVQANQGEEPPEYSLVVEY